MIRFGPEHTDVIDEAVAISEEVVSDRLGLTSNYWKQNPYEVLTLSECSPWERPDAALAQLIRYDRPPDTRRRASEAPLWFYRICLHDGRILEKAAGLGLKPLLVYVVCHELVHITRFSGFACMVTEERKRAWEETVVHGLTRSLLEDQPVAGLDRVVAYFDQEPYGTQGRHGPGQTRTFEGSVPLDDSKGGVTDAHL